MSDMLRITGMVSGMDTDATVKKLIALEQTKVDKAEQDKQILEWQRDQYRDLSATMKSFQDEFLNLLSPSNNLMSKTAFNVFTPNVSSAAISVTTTGKSTGNDFTIASIDQLATKDAYLSDSAVVGKITGSDQLAPIADILAKVQAGENTLTFNLDGVSKTITLDPASFNNYATSADLVNDLNDKLSEVYPSLNVVASESGGTLSFDVKRAGVAEAGHKLTIGSAHTGLLADLKLENGQANYLKSTATLASAFGLSGDIALTINGVSDFGITSEDSIDDVIDKINKSDAGVTISYNEFEDTFKLESNVEGSTNAMALDDAGGLLAALKLNAHNQGLDAIFTVQTGSGAVQTSRSSNAFEFEGNQVTLNSLSAEAVKVTIDKDVSSVKDKIVKFVDSYNKLIEKINKKSTEKRYYDFAPLTSAQKEDLEEEEEKKWQEKAQSGLLRGDGQLRQITAKFRQALYESVKGVGITLKDIGITGSSDFMSGGKLSIDEAKLDKALSEKPNEVAKLFTSNSEHEYLDSAVAKSRYEESGLAHRLNDIIKDNIRTVNGKGYFLIKAGSADIVDTKSDIYKQIKQMDSKIDKLMDLLADKEDKYYRQFARMESVMSKYSAQSSWLMGQFGG